MTDPLLREGHPPIVSGTNSLLVPALRRAGSAAAPAFAFFASGDRWEEVSYAAFIDRALQFARLYRQAEVGAGEVIFLILRHGLDAHAAFAGAMLIGAIPSYLPFPNAKQDVALYWKHHRKVFVHTAASAVLVYDELKDSLRNTISELDSTILTASAADGLSPLSTITLPADSSTALLQHSSGTTGLKKGVALTYDAICLQLDLYADALGLGAVEHPVFASWLPLYHDMGLIASFLMPLRLGIPIVSLDPFDWVARPGAIFDGIERYRATHAWFPNFAFLHTVAATQKGRVWDLSSIVAITNCSEPCKASAFDVFLERFGASGLRADALRTSYASAETVFAVSQSVAGAAVRRLQVDPACIESLSEVRPPPPGETGTTLLTNGPPLHGCEVAVLRDGEIRGEGAIGEIVVKAAYLFAGYYKNEEATRQAFVGDWYRSGDIGFVERGEVFIVGRIKDIVITNGKNVFAHDVEAAIAKVRGLKPGRSVAFGFFSEAAGSEQLIVVAERNDEARSATTIAIEVNHAVLEEVGVPCSDIRVVDPGWLVKTTSGKISRAENATKYTRMFRSGPVPDQGL